MMREQLLRQWEAYRTAEQSNGFEAPSWEKAREQLAFGFQFQRPEWQDWREADAAAVRQTWCTLKRVMRGGG